MSEKQKMQIKIFELEYGNGKIGYVWKPIADSDWMRIEVPGTKISLELQLTADNRIELRTTGGIINIEPMAANVVTIQVKR
jgi:hypothetical protein